ncbi:MAG: TonB-dependent receptor [Candidatus Eisenbacteria bacterium]|nr:TonB-dependent receptor [Candidatus Eisenbacteria bacterium]
MNGSRTGTGGTAMNPRKRTAILLAFLLLAGATAWAQAPAGTIAGVVRDAATGDPLPHAALTLEGTANWGGESEEQGIFQIPNIPPGVYNVKVQLMGYATATVPNVEVRAGETTRLPVELREEVATLEGLSIVGKKEKIDKGSTSTKYTKTGADISKMPVDDLVEAIGLNAGVIAKGGELHFRGGRAGEVQVQVDGMPVRDPLVGGQVSLAMTAVNDLEVLTGGLDAKYGNAQSGVILYRTKEGGERFGGEVRYITDDYGSPKNTYDNYDRVLLGLGGPLPVPDLTYYISAEATYQDDYPKTRERRGRENILNFISVGDRKNNEVKLQGKLAYKPGADYKLTFEVLDQSQRYDSYYHAWSRAGYVQQFLDTTRTEEVVLRHGRWSLVPLDSTYVYYNAAEHTPNVRDEFRQYKAVFHHSLSKDAQYSVKMSSQHFFTDSRVLGKNEWEYEGQRDRDYWFNYTDLESYDFFVTCGDYPALSTRETRVYQGLFDLTWKHGKHTFETGLSGTYNDMRFFSVTRPYLNNTQGEIGASRSVYHFYNPEGAFYAQDRWEHEGMVLNIGVRYDINSVGDQVPISDVTERVKKQLSPRVGIGYPISDRDVFSFHYARLYQMPDRQYVYDNRDVYDGVRGNPNLENETTIQYQAAIQHLFSELLVGQFSVYYKDIYGLITAEEIPDWTATGNITSYVNKDYASSKGFEVSLSRGWQNYMRWDLSYGYGVANGVASDPNAAISRNFVYLPTGEQPLDWDVRHSVSVNLGLGDQRSWGVNLIWEYQTGTPYTPIQRNTRETEPETINSRRLPSETNLNIRADKYYTLWGKRLSLFVDARNVLDAKNITWLSPTNWPPPPVTNAYTTYYTETGRAGGAYLADHNEDGIEEFIPLNDPRVFGNPRTIRMGVGFEF